MWCANCQADVAAEVATDNRRVRCAACGSEITAAHVLTNNSKTLEARELLERWSSDKLLDPYGPLPGGKPVPEITDLPHHQTAATVDPPQSQEAPHTQRSPSKPVFRIDALHRLQTPPLPREEPRPAAELQPGSAQSAGHSVGVSQMGRAASGARLHPGHASMGPPHFDVRSMLENPHRCKTNWVSLSGQLLAYLGVAGLTVGTSLVLWGYFGGPDSYTPTGWLITTAGQMLLFLGVITLMSSGMEQTTEEVAGRIDTLGKQLLRIEQVLRQQSLRSPSIPAQDFADAPPESTSAEHTMRTPADS